MKKSLGTRIGTQWDECVQKVWKKCEENKSANISHFVENCNFSFCTFLLILQMSFKIFNKLLIKFVWIELMMPNNFGTEQKKAYFLGTLEN